MTTSPTWSPTDDSTADLLSVLADDGSVSTDYEWELYVDALRSAADYAAMSGNGPTINPNTLRCIINGRIKPQRVGAFTHRALSAGLVEYTGQYVISTDTAGRNGGKPCRELRWIGGAA